MTNETRTTLIRVTLFELIAERLKQRNLEPTTPTDTMTIAGLGLDSLDAVEIALELEERLNIIVPNERVTTATTVGSLIALLEEQQPIEK